MAFVLVIFFLASAGASSAYLTVSEIFPMESRALSIAFFYAVGTATGGIAGPLLFGHLINTGSQSQVAIGFFIGAVVMAIGGVAELLFGVKAEQKQLEEIAEPLTAKRAETKEKERPEDHEGRRRIRSRAGRLSTTSRGMPVSAPFEEVPLDQEIEIIDRALQEHGSANRRELWRRVGGRYWGPGRFRAALREAVAENRVKRLKGGEYAPASAPPPERANTSSPLTDEFGGGYSSAGIASSASPRSACSRSSGGGASRSGKRC
jgi:hypothetical protein